MYGFYFNIQINKNIFFAKDFFYQKRDGWALKVSYGLSTQLRTKRQIYRWLQASVSYDGIEGAYKKT